MSEATVVSGYSLAEMENLCRDGRVTDEEMTAYLRAWNATPSRFTQAVWADGRCRQIVPTEQPCAYRRLWAQYGVRAEV